MFKKYQDVMKVFRIIGWFYSVIVFFAASFAWYSHIRFLNRGGEHLLPDLLLWFVTIPASLALDPLYESLPTFIDGPFADLTLLTLCGATQASALFVMENLVSRK